MKAWVLHDINNISCDEVEIPDINNDEALVEVKAAGICGSDIPRIYKTGAYSHPLILGHEFSGVVVKTGKNETGWINKRVGIFPLIPCGECMSCKREFYEMCRNYSYLGSRRNGGFADYVAVPMDNLIELPKNVSFEEAAMFEPMAVAVHAIRRMNIKNTDKIVVCGLGTIGIFIVMFLCEMGIENVYVIGNKEYQKKMVVKIGISEQNYCDSKNEDVDAWIKNKTSESGVDVFFECVGRNETIIQAVNNTESGGRAALVGNPYSDVSLDKATYWKILRNQLTLKGTWNSSFTHKNDDDWHYVLGKLEKRRINPTEFVSHKFSMEELEKGFSIMKDKSEDYIKIMMVNGIDK